MEEGLISVCLLTYQHEKFVEDSLEGLLTQTQKNVELILVDDASTDGTVELIKSFIPRLKQEFKRVVTIFHEKNSGNISKNINEALKQSKGEYIFEIAGDDILLPNGLYILKNALDNNKDCGLAHANAYIIQENYHLGEWYDKSQVAWYGRLECKSDVDLTKKLVWGSYKVHAPTTMFRRSIIEDIGFHDESIPTEDFEFWLRMSTIIKFYYIDKAVVLYRRTSNSLTNFWDGDKSWKLQRAFYADKIVLNRYIGLLKDNKKQNERWQRFYECFYRDFEKAKDCEWVDKIKSEMQLKGLKIPVERQKDYDKSEYYLNLKIKLYAKWIEKKNEPNYLSIYMENMDCKNVGIYGYGDIGKSLYLECVSQNINVLFVMDRGGNLIDCPTDVFVLGDEIPVADLLIVTVMDGYKELSCKLREKTSAKIISIWDIVMD